MDAEATELTIKAYLKEVRERLDKAAGIARAADACAGAGFTLNVLLSFAQFEREVTGERIRDKIAASKKKGMWMGGWVPLGYERKERTLIVNDVEAKTIRTIFDLFLKLKNVRKVQEELARLKLRTKPYATKILLSV